MRSSSVLYKFGGWRDRSRILFRCCMASRYSRLARRPYRNICGSALRAGFHLHRPEFGHARERAHAAAGFPWQRKELSREKALGRSAR